MYDIIDKNTSKATDLTRWGSLVQSQSPEPLKTPQNKQNIEKHREKRISLFSRLFAILPRTSTKIDNHPSKRRDFGVTKLQLNVALSMLPNSQSIHVQRYPSATRFGVTMTRAQVVDLINQFGAEDAGRAASECGHGLVIRDDHGFLFVETLKK